MARTFAGSAPSEQWLSGDVKVKSAEVSSEIGRPRPTSSRGTSNSPWHRPAARGRAQRNCLRPSPRARAAGAMSAWR